MDFSVKWIRIKIDSSLVGMTSKKSKYIQPNQYVLITWIMKIAKYEPITYNIDVYIIYIDVISFITPMY